MMVDSTRLGRREREARAVHPALARVSGAAHVPLCFDGFPRHAAEDEQQDAEADGDVHNYSQTQGADTFV